GPAREAPQRAVHARQHRARNGERVTTAAPRPQQNGQELLTRQRGGASAPEGLARPVVFGMLGQAQGHGGNVGGAGGYPGTRITRNAELGTRNRRADLVSAVPRSAFRVPRLGRPVALLELLTAAAGTRVVAADPGVGIRDWRARGGLRPRGRVAPDQAVGLRLRCHHGGGAPRTADGAGARPAHGGPADVTLRRAELVLQLESELGARGVYVNHAAAAHIIDF